ncbi:MAG TPA: response regulator [Bacteroidetes bacterium]|nr:response regulator [Caldisericaceae bacterium]HHE65551.1 response regulator [Bacteroidota bacterium]
MKKILAIDDDWVFVNSLKNILEMKDFKVDVMSNPFNVEEYLSKQKADCILLDFKMFGLNGLELIRQIRKINADVPIIMISAVEIKHINPNPLEIGANLYIEKPFDIEELVAGINSLINSN